MRLQNYRWVLSFLSIGGLAACGDDAKTSIDAPKGIDSKLIDAPADGPSVNYDSKEGGEVRLEYVQFNTTAPPPAAHNRARGTSFFFGGPNGGGFHQFPDIPGCTDMTANPPTRYPFAQDASRVYLDVGQVIISGGPQQMTLAKIPMIGPNDYGRDNAGRAYTGPWNFAGQAPGPVLNDMAPNFIAEDTTYDVILTGSADWPAQIFKDVLYVPPNWAPIDPAVDVNPVLMAGTPMVITHTAPTPAHMPTGYTINTLVFFSDGVNHPVAVCIEEGTDGSITIPANIVDLVRAALPTGGKMARQHATHVVREMTDGTSHDNKRIDFVGVWCYNYSFTVAP